jgi:hypothetical protein
MMRMAFTCWQMDHSTITMGTILTKRVMISLVATMMKPTTIIFLGLVMKKSTMQSIRNCTEMRSMRRMRKLLNNFKF